MIERFLKAKKEKLSNNQLCEEIATHIYEGRRTGPAFICRDPYRILKVHVEEPWRQAFEVAVYEYGLFGRNLDAIRFEKVEGGDWVAEREVELSRRRTSGAIEWEKISEEIKAKDLPKLLKMVNNSTPSKHYSRYR